MKLLQINVTANWGSTGKIAEAIGYLAISQGWDSWIAYGRGKPYSASNLVRIGNDWDMRMHGLQTRLLDNHGLASKGVTKQFIEQVKEIKPDIIHLHNIHGYYINYPELFKFLKEFNAPIVWTLHDCWPFTGHCAYYDFAQCSRWQTECHDCPQKKAFPTSWLTDRSQQNYQLKKETFLGCSNLTFIPVSNWLDTELKQSFLSSYPSTVIHNGINLSVFKFSSTKKIDKKKIILGVASVWDHRKGLDEFVKLREKLPENYQIILVGLNQKQIAQLPNGITGICRTKNVGQLVDLYSQADVFINPTLEDNFPTTNLEALACGTPVITYQTGGSPEAIDRNTGVVVKYQDVNELAEMTQWVCETHPFSPEDCRNRVETLFNQDIQFSKYIHLYHQLLS